eukprot:IDg17768t1
MAASRRYLRCSPSAYPDSPCMPERALDARDIASNVTDFIYLKAAVSGRARFSTREREKLRHQASRDWSAVRRRRRPPQTRVTHAVGNIIVDRRVLSRAATNNAPWGARRVRRRMRAAAWPHAYDSAALTRDGLTRAAHLHYALASEAAVIIPAPCLGLAPCHYASTKHRATHTAPHHRTKLHRTAPHLTTNPPPPPPAPDKKQWRARNGSAATRAAATAAMTTSVRTAPAPRS